MTTSALLNAREISSYNSLGVREHSFRLLMMCRHVGSNSFYSVVLPPPPSKTTTTRKMAKGRIYLFSFLTSFRMVGESLHFSAFLHSSSATILQVAIEAL
jgi:hypothetical protein